MKTAIIYYSRSGNTRYVANVIKNKLEEKDIQAYKIEIKAKTKPNFVKAINVALNQKELPIKNPCYDLSDYDTLILGVPSWANYPAPYYRTFIKKAENFDIKTIGVFITGGRAIKTNEKTMEVFKNEQ